MLMEIYRDTTGLFTSKECDYDNVIMMEFDDDVVKEYFEKNCSGSYGFDEWLTRYTCDDTETLYDFAVSKGKKPIIT